MVPRSQCFVRGILADGTFVFLGVVLAGGARAGRQADGRTRVSAGHRCCDGAGLADFRAGGEFTPPATREQAESTAVHADNEASDHNQWPSNADEKVPIENDSPPGGNKQKALPGVAAGPGDKTEERVDRGEERMAIGERTGDLGRSGEKEGALLVEEYGMATVGTDSACQGRGGRECGVSGRVGIEAQRRQGRGGIIVGSQPGIELEASRGAEGVCH